MTVRICNVCGEEFDTGVYGTNCPCLELGENTPPQETK